MRRKLIKLCYDKSMLFKLGRFINQMAFWKLFMIIPISFKETNLANSKKLFNLKMGKNEIARGYYGNFKLDIGFSFLFFWGLR